MSDASEKASLTDQLVSRHFGRQAGVLTVDGFSIDQLAAEFGTPCFVYSEQALQNQWQALRACYPECFQILYSMKANPHQAFLRFFTERGAGLEIASGGELYQALKSGCPAERILFAGPGKTDKELVEAVAAGTGEVHLESLAEAQRLNQIADRQGRSVSVSLRINPASQVQGGAMRMGGRPLPFGIDEELLEETAIQVAALPHLEIAGLHLFTGTQILDPDVLIAQYRYGVQLAERLIECLGQPLRSLDFGGGLGIPYFAHEQTLDLSRLQSGLKNLAQEIREHPGLSSTRLMIEPGRFLVGECGLYVTRITDVKISRGKRFVITDGGMHHHLAASGNLGQTIKRNYPMAVLNRLDDPLIYQADVVGPLCTPLDVLGRQVSLPDVQVGDLVGVFQSGAYARTSSPLHFLGHVTPPEVWVSDSNARLIRQRGDYEAALIDQMIPESTTSHHAEQLEGK